MPYLYALLFMVAWHHVQYWLCVIALVMVFSACSTSTHDVVHRSLGLTARQTEWLLCLLGLPVLESGHAYRLTHLNHHKRFPHDDDLEGEAAHMPIWKVILVGPLFLPKLWLYGWQAAKDRPDQRRWLILEALFPIVGVVCGWLLLPVTSGLLAFSVTVLLSSFFYPLFAVHLPHRHFEEPRVKQAWTCRGRWIPRIFLPLAYHLEHHLYPLVPSHNLPKLAERLEPTLLAAGVEPIHVP
ncbi:MAG: fatty acid desaturase [Armatimonadetes bacterium]|nr:fatty acid desaturase [Armatimonadota bacterium]